MFWSQQKLELFAILIFSCFAYATCSSYGENCSSTVQCFGANQNCSEGVCVCANNFSTTLSTNKTNSNICRVASGGGLTSSCLSVIDCNYKFVSVLCVDKTCQCPSGQEGFTNSTTCFNKGYSNVLIRTIIVVCILVVALFAAVLIYRCITRSPMTKPVRWLHRSSHVELNWSDFPTLRRSFRNSLRRLSRRRCDSASRDSIAKPSTARHDQSEGHRCNCKACPIYSTGGTQQPSCVEGPVVDLSPAQHWPSPADLPATSETTISPTHAIGHMPTACRTYQPDDGVTTQSSRAVRNFLSSSAQLPRGEVNHQTYSSIV